MAKPISKSLEEKKFEFEQDMRTQELELRKKETNRGALTVAQASLGAAVLALISGLGGAWVSGNLDVEKTRETGHASKGVQEIKNQGTIDIEKFRLQKDLVLKAIAKEDPADVRKTLLFFAEGGLLNVFKKDLTDYLNRTGDEDLPTGPKLGNLDLVIYQRKVRRFRPLLDVIGAAETNGNYNAFFAEKNNISKPSVVSMTLSEVRKWQDARVENGSPSSATGRYLFLRKTLDALKNEVGLNGSEPFDSLTQDVLAVRLLERRGLNKFLAGRLSANEFMLSLAKEWASIPVPENTKGHKREVTKGESYYSGDQLNYANVKLDKIIFALDSISAAISD